MGSLSLACPNCLHDRVVFQTAWTERIKEPNGWQTLMLCSHCGVGMMALLRWKPRPNQGESAPTNMGGDVSTHFEVAKTWPELPKLGAPLHTPSAVAKRFVEGEDAFARKNWNSAVAMYRSALDIATKGMSPEAGKLMLNARLKWMLENGRLTKDLWEWADKVRLGGNDAIHDPDDFAETDAKPLRFFTEMFLRYVFELPGEVARLRSEPSPAN